MTDLTDLIEKITKAVRPAIDHAFHDDCLKSKARRAKACLLDLAEDTAAKAALSAIKEDYILISKEGAGKLKAVAMGEIPATALIEYEAPEDRFTRDGAGLVKPLVWEDFEEVSKATTAFDNYLARQDYMGLWNCSSSTQGCETGISNGHFSLKEAKAAAQEHHEARALSLLNMEGG